MKRLFPVLLLVFAGAAMAQEPQGEPRAAEALKDTEFGVTTRQFALQRHVEMFQWQKGDAGYRKVWNGEPIASSGFDAEHRNPGTLPVQTRFWVAGDVSLDGKPVHEDVLKQLGTWHDFRPGFTALPGNLSATFQPEGDGLSSTENPLDPKIGDLRITWREMRLPELQGKVVLADGRWVPGEAASATSESMADASATAIADAADPVEGRGMPMAYWLAGIALAVVALLVLLSRRRKGRR